METKKRTIIGLMGEKSFGILTILFLNIMFLSSCKKDKIDFTYDNRKVLDAEKGSNVRLVNLSNYNQIRIDGDSLTNFQALNPEALDFYKYKGTKFFPDGGRLGKTWVVPQSFFGKSNQINVFVAYRHYYPAQNQETSFIAENNYNKPFDYYLLHGFLTKNLPNYFIVERDITSPSKPDNIKIRVINLTGEYDRLPSNPSGTMEKLGGSVTLTYADGTEVDPKTSHVSGFGTASAYVELPYGTYQFRALTEDGRQFPGKGASTDFSQYLLIDPPTSTIPNSLMDISNLTFMPVQYFAPGGVYTIVISPQEFNYYINEREYATLSQNAVNIITDVEPSANLSYYRAQAINAWNDQAVNISIEGVELSKGLEFGKASEYKTFLFGKKRIEAKDESGKILASKDYETRAGENYSIWLYANKAKEPEILVIPNDLSGTIYRSTTLGYTQPIEDDASNNWEPTRMPFYRRYLNLSFSYPYITFTSNNGQTLSTDANYAPDANLQPGIPLEQFPYLRSRISTPNFNLKVFRSAPEVVPGNWAHEIPTVNNEVFIANKSLYSKASRKLPVQEAGFYTVALIGDESSAKAVLKPQILIVKHNK